MKTCKKPSSRMAQPQTPSQSRPEWNRAVYFHPHSWTSFFLYCCLTPLAGQKMVCTRNDGNLFNLARLWAKTKVRKVLIRKILFTDDAALTAHTENALQRLIITFALASLVSPSVTKRPTSLAKTSATSQASPSTTTLSRRWRTSLT